MSRMYEHFARVSAAYNDVRTTDLGPVLCIREKLKDREHVRGADIGCGGGRYDLLLLQNLPSVYLTCGDVNQLMVEETARYLKSHGQRNFTALRVDATDFRLAQESLDCVLTFNAIHHFDPIVFLQNATEALRSQGYVFIYTRLRSQNARNLWGRFFPGFVEKESRLYDLAQVEAWLGQRGSLRLETIEFFRFQRVAPLEHLLHQAENKHYSTFSLYSPEEFGGALSEFKQRIEHRFPDLDRIEWADENVMIVFRKD
jgi:SAM-dependent methyltransferase